MKKVKLIHKEPNEECFEILQSMILEDKQLKKYRIDKNTMLQSLPESIVNDFLDFISGYKGDRSLLLYLIKKGTVTVECTEE